jgi:hypothetical protein
MRGKKERRKEGRKEGRKGEREMKIKNFGPRLSDI